MKAIPVTELRQRTAEVLDEVRSSYEPFLILQRSQKAAYLVDAAQYDAQMAELRAEAVLQQSVTSVWGRGVGSASARMSQLGRLMSHAG